MTSSRGTPSDSTSSNEIGLRSFVDSEDPSNDGVGLRSFSEGMSSNGVGLCSFFPMAAISRLGPLSRHHDHKIGEEETQVRNFRCNYLPWSSRMT